jgi:hypothetical protein
MPEEKSSTGGSTPPPALIQPSSSQGHSNHSNIDEDIPPPPYTPYTPYTPSPSVDSVQDGPLIGPDGQCFQGGSSSYGYGTGIELDEGGPGSQPPPAFTEKYGQLEIDEDGMETLAEVAGMLPPQIL